MIKHEKHTNGMCKFRDRPLTGCVVECDSLTQCDRCGWNPEVEKERKHLIRLRMQGETITLEEPEKWLIGRGEFPR